MLFSIVIPTYNPGTVLIRLLKSIDDNFCIDDIEIIISDDCSTEPLDDLLEKFNHLNIRKITNDKHYGFPRVGRQNGMDAAQGKWITVIDQDDYFEQHIFDKLRRSLLFQDAQNCIYSSVNVVYENTGAIILRDCPEEGTQGKFYEKEFIEKYNIRYDEVDYVEDANFGMHVKCILAKYNLKSVTWHEVSYNWLQHEGSLSDMLHKNTYYFHSRQDYIKSIMGVAFEEYEKIEDDELKEKMCKIFKIGIAPQFFKIYFDFLGIQHPNNKCEQLPDSYFELIKSYFQKYKAIFNITTEEFLHIVENESEMLDLYTFQRHNTYNYIPFIETITFRDWVYKYLD